MLIEYKGQEYSTLRQTPIPFSSHWHLAQLKEKISKMGISQTRLCGTDLVIYENQLFPTQESYSFGVLVGHIAKATLQKRDPSMPFVIVDVGTGVGTNAIGIAKTLKDEKQQVVIVGSDVSGQSLATADTNAKLNGIDFIKLRKRDLLTGIRAEFGRVDMIVSNPPWFPSKKATKEKGSYQPRLALDGGVDGLDFYRALFNQVSSVLSDYGLIAVRTQDCAWQQVHNEATLRLKRPEAAAITHSFTREGVEHTRRTGLLYGSLASFDIKTGYATYIDTCKTSILKDQRRLGLVPV